MLPLQMFLTDRVTRPFVNPVIDMSCQPNRFMCGSHGCSADSSVDSFTSTGSHTEWRSGRESFSASSYSIWQGLLSEEKRTFGSYGHVVLGCFRNIQLLSLDYAIMFWHIKHVVLGVVWMMEGGRCVMMGQSLWSLAVLLKQKLRCLTEKNPFNSNHMNPQISQGFPCFLGPSLLTSDFTKSLSGFLRGSFRQIHRSWLHLIRTNDVTTARFRHHWIAGYGGEHG